MQELSDLCYTLISKIIDDKTYIIRSSVRDIVLEILFWNVHRKDLRVLVCDVANDVSADVVILIENSVTADQTLECLRSEISPAFEKPRAIDSRFQLFSRSPRLDLSEVYSGNRISIRRLWYMETELLLGIVHLVDNLNWDKANQQGEVMLLANEIRRQETKAGHNQTVILGDFNMNPFDQAMHIATGMNAMMTSKSVEKSRSRILQKRSYPFFYNPMWNLFGDRTPGPAGTFYHQSPSSGMYGWNMLDQVLIRPDAIKWFYNVEILTSAGNKLLQNRQERPDKRNASDHFPIHVTLK